MRAGAFRIPRIYKRHLLTKYIIRSYKQQNEKGNHETELYISIQKLVCIMKSASIKCHMFNKLMRSVEPVRRLHSLPDWRLFAEPVRTYYPITKFDGRKQQEKRSRFLSSSRFRRRFWRWKTNTQQQQQKLVFSQRVKTEKKTSNATHTFMYTSILRCAHQQQQQLVAVYQQ